MKLNEATAGFIAAWQESGDEIPVRAGFESPVAAALDLLESRFANPSIAQLTAAELRDFLARWYVEEASTNTVQAPSPSLPPSALPSAIALIDTLSAFFKWVQDRLQSRLFQEHLSLLSELRESVPRALEINFALSKHLAGRGGAFNFPEFLTSFEEGGHSQYDIGAGGTAGAIEGYFRVLRIEGMKVEAEELISETRLYPIIFPATVIEFLRPDDLLNLEIVHTPEAWQIIHCGFAYPPNTEL